MAIRDLTKDPEFQALLGKGEQRRREIREAKVAPYKVADYAMIAHMVTHPRPYISMHETEFKRYCCQVLLFTQDKKFCNRYEVLTRTRESFDARIHELGDTMGIIGRVALRQGKDRKPYIHFLANRVDYLGPGDSREIDYCTRELEFLKKTNYFKIGNVARGESVDI